MIIVHDIFVCKPGNASKAAKVFKEMMGDGPHFVNIMTDMSGQFHRVIMVSKYETLAEWEEEMEKMMKGGPDPKMEEGMKKLGNFNEMYLTGSREIYRTW